MSPSIDRLGFGSLPAVNSLSNFSHPFRVLFLFDAFLCQQVS